MKTKITIWIIAMLMVIPALAIAEEGESEPEISALELGAWTSKRLIALDFKEKVQNITTTSSELQFIIMDERGAIGSIFSNFMYTKRVYIVYGNATEGTVITPNEAGIFSVKLDNVGEYTIIVMGTPLLPIPVIGDIFFPTAEKTVNIVRERAMPWGVLISGFALVMLTFAMVLVVKGSRRRKLKER